MATSPGQIFAQAFSSGFDQARQERMNMRQMAQQDRQFDVIQSLRERQFGLEEKKAQVEMAGMATRQDLANIQLNVAQYELAQRPKIEAANTLLATAAANAKTPEDIEAIPSKLTAAGLGGVLPMTDVQRVVQGKQLQWAQSENGLAKMNYAQNAIKLSTEAYSLGINPDDPKYHPANGAPPNIALLSQDVLAARTASESKKDAREFEQQKTIAGIKATAESERLGATLGFREKELEQKADLAELATWSKVLETYSKSLSKDPAIKLEAQANIDRIKAKLNGAQPTGASPTPAARPAVTPAAVNYLKQNPGTRAQFDQTFGAGAAAKVLGQ